MPTVKSSHCPCWSVLSSSAHCTSFWSPEFLFGFSQCQTCINLSSLGTCLSEPPTLLACLSSSSVLSARSTAFMPLTTQVAFSWFLESTQLACFSDGSVLIFRPLAQFWKWVFFEVFLSFTSFHTRLGRYPQGFCNDGRWEDFKVLQKEPWLWAFIQSVRTEGQKFHFCRLEYGCFLSWGFSVTFWGPVFYIPAV